MKSSTMASMKFCFAILTISVPIATAAHLRAYNRVITVNANSANLTGSGASGLEDSVRSMVAGMLDGTGPGMHDVVSSVHSKMDILDAVKRLARRSCIARADDEWEAA